MELAVRERLEIISRIRITKSNEDVQQCPTCVRASQIELTDVRDSIYTRVIITNSHVSAEIGWA